MATILDSIAPNRNFYNMGNFIWGVFSNIIKSYKNMIVNVNTHNYEAIRFFPFGNKFSLVNKTTVNHFVNKSLDS